MSRFEPLGICYRTSRIGVAEQLSPDGSLDQDRDQLHGAGIGGCP